MAQKIATHTFRKQTNDCGEKLIRDGAPMNRDWLVELAMGVSIVAILQALYILNNAALLDKVRLSYAFMDKTNNELIFLEKLAIEGNKDDSTDGGFVSLVDMKNGKVAGLKFFAEVESIYLVDWGCRHATVQEIEETIKVLPEANAKKFRELKPVEHSAEYKFKVCKKGTAGA